MGLRHSDFGLIIILSKYPTGKDNNETLFQKNYIKGITDLFSEYRKKIYPVDVPASNFYKPGFFHLYSHFDLATIALIDNYKFSQRLFEPFLGGDSGLEYKKSTTFQTFTGSLFLDEGENENSILEIITSKENFIEIIQLKVNNGLLIGNGQILIDKIVYKIRQLNITDFSDIKLIVLESFNWSEITLVAICNDENQLAKFLFSIRELSINDTIENSNEIIEKSLYFHFLGKEDRHLELIKESHIFSDSYTYFGIECSKKTIESFSDKQIISEIEYQVKPGHYKQFQKVLKESILRKDENVKLYLKNGKTDFLISKSEKFQTNKTVFDIQINDTLHQHVRKVKTRVLFNDAIFDNCISSGSCELHITEASLRKYAIYNNERISKLRNLTISRSIRKKIRKVIFNFNIGIQDPIMYLYFIDLKNLINSLLNILTEKVDSLHNALSFEDDSTHNETTKDLENVIEEYLKVFEEAMDDRLLNNYNYEEINEFALESNSPLTSILSSVDSIVKFVGKTFISDQGQNIVTRIYDNETKSNKISINYNVEQIINPPLIFATLIKEIFNNDPWKSSRYYTEKTKNIIGHLRGNLSSSLFKILNYDSNEIEERLHYLAIDYVKYHLTFLGDFKLLEFWHWTYALQNTAMYNSIGYIDEGNFVLELFRIMFLCIAIDPSNAEDNEIEELECPAPEFRTYWDRHYFRLKNRLSNLDYETKLLIQEYCNKSTELIGGQLLENKNRSESTKITYPFIKRREFDILFSKLQEGKAGLENIDYIDKYSASDKIEYKTISDLSYYSLYYIYQKFDKKTRLLRRSYETGDVVEDLVDKGKKWFIDPFGGFFIYGMEDRRSYIKFCNKILNIMWDIGIKIKKDFF